MPAATADKPLKGVRILSLALNLPGPAALMRCRQMGAQCVKLEPPAPPSAGPAQSGDPMSQYSPEAYAAMHQGVRVFAADLKTALGQKRLHRELARAKVLLTSFRPSALEKLGLGWTALHRQYPGLNLVAIVGAAGQRAEEPGHDLTYLAEHGLINGLDLPPTLFADMSGALAASEAMLAAVLQQTLSGKSSRREVSLSGAASWLALPRSWGLVAPGSSVGGGHAGYQVYACRDGRVALAALEPHFAERLCSAISLEFTGAQMMLSAKTRTLVAKFFASQSRAQIDTLARRADLPLHTLVD